MAQSVILAQPLAHSLGSSNLLRPSVPALSTGARFAPLRVQSIFRSKPEPPKKAGPPQAMSGDAPRPTNGIFGTSGRFGFTKKNELFVGRVAMLGFAASLLGEAITGQGILKQINIETGIPLYEAEPLLLAFIGFTLLGAIGGLGERGRFIDLDTPTKSKTLRGKLGLRESGPFFGFTKANEIFVGRVAQLGFVASLIGEVITGKGALAQLNIETGVPIWELEPLVLFNILFFFIAAINPGSGTFVNDDDV